MLLPEKWTNVGKFNPEDTLDAVWCVDSETGKRYLLGRKTSQIIATEKEMKREGL